MNLSVSRFVQLARRNSRSRINTSGHEDLQSLRISTSKRHMHILVAILSFALLLIVLWDAFETVILPRRVTRSYRLARLFYRNAWRISSAVARAIPSAKMRDAYLGYYGPLSLLVLFGIWAGSLVFAFGMLHWAAGSIVGVAGQIVRFRTDLYFSGTTFFTLGMGDVVPGTAVGRVISVAEAGTGFGFLAIVISYLPTMYNAFSQRETNISLLDARAGSPPTAAELLRRHGRQRSMNDLGPFLHDWETWSAQLMESHLTYPFLCFFRSQHDNQSWLAAFTAILDICALFIAYAEGESKWQAQLTFAISRHAVVDLSQVLKVKPVAFSYDRLPPADLLKVRSLLLDCGVARCSEASDLKLRELRGLYEPYLNALSKLLLIYIPSWGLEPGAGASPSSVWGRVSSMGSPPESQTVAPHEIESGHL